MDYNTDFLDEVSQTLEERDPAAALYLIESDVVANATVGSFSGKGKKGSKTWKNKDKDPRPWATKREELKKKFWKRNKKGKGKGGPKTETTQNVNSLQDKTESDESEGTQKETEGEPEEGTNINHLFAMEGFFDYGKQ